MQENIKLFWIDKQVNNYENTNHQQSLKKIISNCVFIDNIDTNSEQDLAQFHQQRPPIVIAGPSYAYSLVKCMDEKMLIFCGNEDIHLELFLGYSQITTMISSGIIEVESQIKRQVQFTIKQQQLESEFNQQPFEECQYQHNTQAISFHFLLLHEKLKNQNVSEQSLYQDLKNILEHSVYEEIYQKKDNTMSLFQNLIYYYSMESQQGSSFYKILNNRLSKCQYDNIENIIMVLFSGYSQAQASNQQKITTLFRGLRFSTQQQYQQTLETLSQNNSSYFWNTLISTSVEKESALKFATKSNYGILFEIELDSENPHPYYKLLQAQFENEKEVLLFPQFQFIISAQYESNYQSKPITIIKIKQKVDDFSMALNPVKREQYWNIRIAEVRQSLEIISQFLQSRLLYLIKILKKPQYPQQQDKMSSGKTAKFNPNEPNSIEYFRQELKKEMDNYFDEFRLIICIGDVMEQDKCFKILKEACQFHNLKITQDFLDDLLKELKFITNQLMDEFINNVKKIYDFGKFNAIIVGSWTKLVSIYRNSVVINGSFDIDPPLFLKPTAKLHWRQIQGEKITKLQIVKHSNSGRVAYEATFQDGNKVLLHDINSNPGDLTQVLKNKVGETQPGYTDNWQKSGEAINTNNLNVKDVQTSVQGKNTPGEKFNLKNFQSNKLSYNPKQVAQCGGAIGGMVSATIVDCCINGFQPKQVAKNLGIGGTVIAIQTACVPAGLAISGLMASFQIGNVLFDKLKTKLEKKEELVKIGTKTGLSIAGFWAGIEGGAAIGTFAAGPVGTVAGGILGGIVAGATTTFAAIGIDQIGKFAFKVYFSVANLSKLINGQIQNPGINPKVEISNVREKARSLILLAVTKNRVVWICTNIASETKIISENDKNYGICYLGPTKDDEQLTFHLFGVTQQHVNIDTVLSDLNNDKFQKICQSKVTIKL